MAPKKTSDHWSFLEEIEAPTWVDLTLETEYNGPDAAEEWFNVTHKFHQCSSHQLRSGFSRHFEGKVTSEFKLQGSFSPKLPSSVSRSRGKDYGQKKLRHDPERIFPKAHPLKDIGSKSPYQERGSYQEIKLRVATMKPKGSSTSRTGLVHENVESYSSNAKFNYKASVNEIGMSSTSTTSTGAMNSQSSITFESSLPQQQSVLDIYSQAFSNSSGLLSIARRSLRKSCVTRQASRLEIKNDADQRRGCRSSSGVSSVSSSSVPGVDVNSASSVLAEVKDITPDSRNVTRMLQTNKNMLKSSNVSKMQVGFIQQGTSCSAIRGITATANSAGEKAAKLKVQKSTSRNAVHHLRIKGRNVLTSSREDKAITKISSSKCAVSNGKENVRGNRTFSESCTGKNIAIGGAKLARRETNHDLSQPCGRRLLADSKVKLKAQIEGKTTRGATLKMHAQ